MTQEEYEAKVQPMPKELQSQFRQSLEINLSKRIFNRFMSVVMQAYAWGQRDAQTGEGSHNAAYMRGAQDMKYALKTVFDMTPIDIYKYFGHDHTGHWDAVYDVLHSDSAVTIMETVKKRMEDEKVEEDERQKKAVQAMADEIGIGKLCEIAEEIRRQKAAEGECLPF